jgi:hypothetical protein
VAGVLGCLLMSAHFFEDRLRECLQKFFASQALPADGELGFGFGPVAVVVGDRRQKRSPYGCFYAGIVVASTDKRRHCF